MTTEWNRPVSEDTQLAAPRRGGRGRIGLPSVRTGLPHRILAPAAIVLAVAALGALWAATAQPVTLEVDGMTRLVRTHRTDVESLLLDMGLNVNDVDRITPGPSTALGSVDEVVVQRALQFRILSDGRVITLGSWGKTVGEALADAELVVDAYDEVLVNGVRRQLDEQLSAPSTRMSEVTYRRSDIWGNRRVDPYEVRVIRAVPIVIDDGTLPFEVRTTAQTVGEALRQAEITIYLGDIVHPSLGSEIVTSMRVTIQRSLPVVVEADGRVVRTRTRGETVSDALAETKIGFAGLDVVEPGLDEELHDGIRISITRVSHQVEVEEEIASFETVYVPDTTLPIDTQQMMEPGAEGITRSRFRIRYENGQETERRLEDTWVAQEPAERVIAYGQGIEPQTFTAADGRQITYWRKIRMFASSYSAGTAGVSPDKSYYGRTYTGEIMRFGIVAVDPAIIPLRSQVYVQDYGLGDALDIGSAIRARRIDLGYDDSNLVMWNRWVDVYLLWPPPPAHQITWVLPNWPRLPQ
ncbi:MAG: ubiquitin-like domain-containing protein [Chloroflexota bacterium]|nr:ubiquitin-like domain-containing protein [Chloroflexota bacterium]